MSNHSKHVAVKNDYYSGKMFGSASTHNIHLNIRSAENVSIFNIRACAYPAFGLG
ncbi:hypothetical protein SRABI27_01721 [Pedobacter sp. Bi27]|nr:hypothetical protein SRABI36_01382 [Pedobacter sp. Bi36]CAH0200105.1 hypothetical protein SRABI27_01721 [Pedobacter sp. Bi27]CAH0231752.1 hypothetical protein SRABI126_02475 [Pedobacter sp. Bi126]